LPRFEGLAFVACDLCFPRERRCGWLSALEPAALDDGKMFPIAVKLINATSVSLAIRSLILIDQSHARRRSVYRKQPIIAIGIFARRCFLGGDAIVDSRRRILNVSVMANTCPCISGHNLDV